ncbi:ATP-binding protein [uncultured Massilia sp.]|uniref:ATP-binding protein n=1 Tax=uncultured Massilia sp. TaxID=169973 RepID=UPI0025DC82EE|nr:ATP-binding protein [uncultured Massilia sp.]
MAKTNDERRPDPDALLAQVREEERRAARGRLRIYFGASAGAGKTYAMLGAARALHAEGGSVLVGVVETHGRSETARLLEGLPLLPARQVEYRGRTLPEFDIDAALASGAALVLVDELAHSNVPGSRHRKRWQDVEELLDAGIDVHTTVNVQHLESLNDVVGGITGIRVAETVPDTVFDRADEVVMVDVPADELLERLRTGRVYQRAQAERAAGNFFRKGNLIALRELALRRTADRIEGDVRAYRVEKSIDAIWKTGAVLLACVGPDSGEQVVRACARLAGQLGTRWHAVFVETPALQRLPEVQREHVLDDLRLAEKLGAVTAVLPGSDVAQALAEYAESHNLSKLVLGRPHGRALPWRAPLARRLSRHAPDIDLVEVATPPKETGALLARRRRERSVEAVRGLHPNRYLAGAGASLAAGALAWSLSPWLDLPNIAMLFVLVVVLVGYLLGRGPSVLATCVSVAVLDFFFVPPRLSFAISDFQYLVTFGTMLAVGLSTGQLTALLRFQVRVAQQRENRWRALYEFSSTLSGALQSDQILDAAREFVARAFRARAVLLLPDDDGKLLVPDGAALPVEPGTAQWAFDHAQPAGMGTDTLPASPLFYLPLVAPMRTRGVLALAPEQPDRILAPEQRQQLDTFATVTAIALERVHYIEVAQGALVDMESERLRNSLLAALGHDLRTPLTLLVGVSESLAASAPPLSALQLGLAETLKSEALRMSTLVANLLDMARIQSGGIHLHLDWQSIEEVVGSALRISRDVLAAHHVETRLPADLPLVEFDAPLLERVLCNVLENAAKYTPRGSTVKVDARLRGDWIELRVTDDGPGLPPGREEAIFEKFTRGEKESNTPGVGLGLAICRAIVEAHGGTIRAEQAPGGGARIVIALKRGEPPAVPELEDTLEDHHE